MENNHGSQIASLVLAAGEGSRMKQVKQLLPWKNSNLLNHHLSQLEAAGVSDPVVVLGAHSDQIRQTINEKIRVIEHNGWSKGIGSSIQFGLDYLLRSKQTYQGVFISLIDQPMIKAEHYKSLLNKFLTIRDIVGTAYSDSVGVPAIIGGNYFSEIKDLPADRGAKFLLKKYQKVVKSLPCIGKSTDLDTTEKYKHYFELYGK